MKIYIPLLYSEKVKRPNRNYFLTNILGEDFFILLLSFTYSSIHPFLSITGLFLLQVSFWCIYELGYIENDVIGDKFEEKAILSHNFKGYEHLHGSWQPWVWSIVLSLAGILALSNDGMLVDKLFFQFPIVDLGSNLNWTIQEFFLWLIFLIVLRVTFRIYNHINKQSRVWFYSILQAFRYCGFLAIVTTNTAGLMFLLSIILTRSIQYILYRYLGGKSNSWPMDFPRYFFCLLIYVLLVLTIAVNNRDINLIFNPHILLISGFCLLRGIKHFYNVFIHFLPVSEDGSNQVT